jgi:hypothetical protein
MRTLLFVLSIGVAVSLFTVIAYPQARPIPPGVREAEKQINAQIDEPPAKFKRKSADPGKLQQEADELAKLSAAIPGQIELLRQGQFPKDLEEHLKRIQKLAGQLRSEISR